MCGLSITPEQLASGYKYIVAYSSGCCGSWMISYDDNLLNNHVETTALYDNPLLTTTLQKTNWLF